MAQENVLTELTRKKVYEHKLEKTTWTTLSNEMYDATNVLDENHGGCEVRLEQSGGDGTEALENVGHSSDAREIPKKYVDGKIVKKKEIKKDTRDSTDEDLAANSNRSTGWIADAVLIPTMCIALVAAIYMMFF